MVKLCFVVLPYPYLITNELRLDFEGILETIRTLNRVLRKGLHPSFECPKNIGVFEVSDLDDWPPLKYYLRHYHETHKIYDVTNLFKINKDSETDRVFAYGNIIEFVIESLKVDEVAQEITNHTLSNLDVRLKNRYFNSRINREIYQMYLGRNVLVPKDDSEFFSDPILTVYFVIIVAENEGEFKEISKELKGINISLKEIIPNSISIGHHVATNFIHSPFFGISINPILVDFSKEDEFKFADILSSILNLMASIGELYNILGIIDGVHELCVIARSRTSLELHDKIGKLRINPIKDLRSFYGLKNFRRYEKIFRTILFEDINYLKEYGLKSAEVIWKHEGIPHFPAKNELLDLIDAYSGYELENFFLKKKASTKFISEISDSFEKKFEGLMETLNNYVEDINGLIEGARTTIQLNIAIITLFWTLFFTVLPLILPWLSNVLSYLVTLIEKLPSQWQF